MVTKSAVIGIDIGASESYVAYVGKGIVDLVQNEVSKRATSTLVGFTDRERLLGDAALAQIRSNAKNTCRNFKHLLGRQLDSPDLEKEHFWSTSRLCSTDDGFSGYDLTYKGEQVRFSATQVTAMFLTKLRETTEKWCSAKVVDAVIACPSCFSDVQRQALIDAASIAGIPVLRIMNEHTATALAYGIYRSNDFDPEKPMTVAFCSMGHTLFSVSIVKFVRGKLTVVCEKSDKVGGRELDECMMREFASQFKQKTGNDPLANKKSLFKLEDAVTKTKKILSANSEAVCTVECLTEDDDFSGNIAREDLERMCEPAKARVKAVLDAAKEAFGMKVEEIDSVELVGGGSRVPWVKQVCSEAFGGKEVSTTMNQEESVARGCALQAAILSPLYKVRDFTVEDKGTFSINVGWMGSAADAAATKDDKDGDAQIGGAEGEYKTATAFPANSLMNVVKMLTFYRSGPFYVKAEYGPESKLLPGTPKELGTFGIELPPQTTPKKVKVKAKLTLHGTFNIEGAQMVEEEEYEDVIKEKRELPPDPEDAEQDAVAGGEAKPKGEGQNPSVDGEAPAGSLATPEKKEAPAGSPPAGSFATPEKKEAPAGSPATPEKKYPDADQPMPDTNEQQNGETDVKNQDGENGEAKPQEVGKDNHDNSNKKKEPRFEWVDVVKIKKRTKRTDLTITATGVPGLGPDRVQKRMDEEFKMQAEMLDIVETDEKRNDLESYIFNMRDKTSAGNVYAEFVSEQDNARFIAELQAAEDWLWDHTEATKTQYIDKMNELKVTGDAVAWRCKEHGTRQEWIEAVLGTVKNYREAAEQPGEKYYHIAPEKLGTVVTACDELERWLNEMRVKQESIPKHEKPVLICAAMEKKNEELAKMADEILREPRPAPPNPEKKELEEPAKGEDQQTEG